MGTMKEDYSERILLDDLDRRILAVLQVDASLTNHDLAQRVNEAEVQHLVNDLV